LSSGSLEIVIDDKAKTALVNDLLALSKVGALETNHDGRVEAERLASLMIAHIETITMPIPQYEQRRTLTIPAAITSQRMMPPKMLTKMALT